MTFEIITWPLDPEAGAHKLADSMPPARLSLLRAVASEATKSALPLYLIGGFPRDLLLGRAATDFDLVVEGNAVALARTLEAKHGGKVTVHTKFGTAQWFLPENLAVDQELTKFPNTRPVALDLISARSETYRYPAALPTVRLGTLTDDLRRRDFSINTLALRLDGSHFGELRDELGGVDDLKQGLVRVLHPHSFIDDPTRLFRALRYEQRYGFKIVPETLALMPAARLYIEKLSAERVRHELDLILEEENAPAMLTRLAELQLLTAVHPALGWNQSDCGRFEKRQEPSATEPDSLAWMLWLMEQPRSVLQEINKRLHFPTSLRENLFGASKLLENIDSLNRMKPSHKVSALEELPLEAVRAVGLATAGSEAERSIAEFLATGRNVKPVTTGHTLKKLGLEPGPGYKKILRRLRDAWLDGDVSSEDDEKHLLEEILRK